MALYLEVERRGPSLPGGPVLVVANHPNALVDPLVIFRTAGRPTRPLAKAPLFDQAVVGTVLRALGGLPVYRREDDPDRMHLNERTFDAAIAALNRGEAVQIYPEGQSHSGPSLTPLKTGAARIALRAEERAGWGLGLEIVAVGLTYEGKDRFRGRVVATTGAPLAVADYRRAWEDHPREAVRALTEEIRSRLEAVTLNLDAPEDRALIQVVEHLWTRARGEAGWRERDGLARRLPGLQAFGRALAWLRAHDPERHRALTRTVTRYARIRGLLGATEGDVPPTYRPVATVRYALRELILLLLLAPAALAGAVAWWLPYRIPTWVVASIRPRLYAVSTWKLGAAFVVFPLTLALWVAAVIWVGGLRTGLVALVALPLCGIAAATFRGRLARTAEDIRVFLRTLTRSRSHRRFKELRDELLDALDDVVRESGVETR